jgi:hypothetical protein
MSSTSNDSQRSPRLSTAVARNLNAKRKKPAIGKLNGFSRRRKKTFGNYFPIQPIDIASKKLAKTRAMAK